MELTCVIALTDCRLDMERFKDDKYEETADRYGLQVRPIFLQSLGFSFFPIPAN